MPDDTPKPPAAAPAAPAPGIVRATGQPVVRATAPAAATAPANGATPTPAPAAAAGTRAAGPPPPVGPTRDEFARGLPDEVRPPRTTQRRPTPDANINPSDQQRAELLRSISNDSTASADIRALLGQDTEPGAAGSVSEERLRAFAAVLQTSEGTRKTFAEDFGKLPTMLVIKGLMEGRGYADFDPLGILVDILGLYDARQRDSILLHAAMVDRGEKVNVAFAKAMHAWMADVKKLGRDVDALSQRIVGMDERLAKLESVLEDFCAAAPTLLAELVAASKLINDRSRLNIILNVATPVVCIIIGWLLHAVFNQSTNAGMRASVREEMQAVLRENASVLPRR